MIFTPAENFLVDFSKLLCYKYDVSLKQSKDRRDGGAVPPISTTSTHILYMIDAGLIPFSLATTMELSCREVGCKNAREVITPFVCTSDGDENRFERRDRECGDTGRELR